MERKKLLVITGEVSGDLHGYNIAKELLNNKNIEIHAVGGEKLKSLDVKIISDITPYSTIGVTDFIPFLGKILKAKKKINRAINNNEYHTAIFIDNQGLNIPLARQCKKRGIKCVYYFPPIVSVWDRKNAKIIPKIFDLILCPFEKDAIIYRNNKGNAIFTGHPFIDTVKTTVSKKTTLKKLNLDNMNNLIGIFPGSRIKEIKNLLPVILAACGKLKNNNLNFVISRAHKSFHNLIIDIASQYNIDAKIITGTDYNVIKSCKAIIGASGSLAIETALLKTPMIVVYKTSWLTYFLAKILIKTKFISWPNIILNKKVFPELIQKKFNSDNIYRELLKIIKNSEPIEETDFDDFRQRLGKPGVIKRIVKIIKKEIKK